MIGLMTLLERVLLNPPLTAWFISILIKSTLISAISVIVIRLFRKYSPVTRSHIHTITFLALLGLPLFTFLMPSWHLPLMDKIAASVALSPTLNGAPGLESPDAISAGHNFSDYLLTLLIAVWSAGALLMSLRLLLGLILMKGISSRAKETLDIELKGLIDFWRDRLGVHRKVKLAFSSEVTSPELHGYWHHKIIFPAYAESWPQKNLEMALIHEMAHIKRADLLRCLLGSATVAMYWINPLVWICRRKMINDSEMVCDDFVLETGNDPFVYAEILLGVARQVGRRRFVFPVTVNMSQKPELEVRLMSLMNNHRRRLAMSIPALAAGIFLAIAFVLPLSGMNLLAGETDPQPSPTAPVQKESENIPDPNSFIKVDTPVEMIFEEVPEYPEDAKKNKIEGTVWVKALVDTAGVVKDVRIMKSSGHDLLDKAAMKAAYGCKYKPAMNDNKPVMIWVSYNVSFTLQPESKK